MFIVELESGVFIAPWLGDPGRTLKIGNAKRFKNSHEANIGIAKARKYRQFKNAELLSAD